MFSRELDKQLGFPEDEDMVASTVYMEEEAFVIPTSEAAVKLYGLSDDEDEDHSFYHRTPGTHLLI